MADFPPGGITTYWDASPVMWVRKSVTRRQLDGLVSGIRKDLPEGESLPPELEVGDYLDGALVVTFPDGLTRNQAYEVRQAVLTIVSGATIKFTGVAIGAGIALDPVDVG